MKKEQLTAKQVEHAKPGVKRIEIPAGPPTGLYLVLHPTGKKSWMFRYRYSGKTRGLTLSKSYPDLGLAAARAEAEAAVKDLENNIDPARTKANEDAALERQKHSEALQQDSVANAIDEFLKRGLKQKEKDRGETARILKRETKPWRNRALGDITTLDVHSVLDAIVDGGHSVMACRTRGVLMRFFTWTKSRKYYSGASPMIDVPKPGPDHKNRERVLELGELLEVWRASETFEYPLGPFYRLLILTAQRRGEVASIKWTNVDLEKKIWTLPTEATKSALRQHIVPLSTAAIELLQGLPRFKGPYVFTTGNGTIPINGFSKSKEAMNEAISEKRKASGKRGEMEGWTVHDLRRTAATQMAMSGVQPHVLSAVLNHSPGSTMGITAIYNRFQYTDEKRMALEVWSACVLSLDTKSKRKSA